MRRLALGLFLIALLLSACTTPEPAAGYGAGTREGGQAYFIVNGPTLASGTWNLSVTRDRTPAAFAPGKTDWVDGRQLLLSTETCREVPVTAEMLRPVGGSTGPNYSCGRLSIVEVKYRFVLESRGQILYNGTGD